VLPALEFEIVTVPILVPGFVGVKTTPTIQLPFAARLRFAAQLPGPALLRMEKSPLIPRLPTLTATVPVFETVIDWAILADCRLCGPKVSVIGEATSIPIVATPVPDKATDTGLAPPDREIVRVPFLVPVWVGVNVTLTEQLPPAERLMLEVQLP